MSVSYNLHFVLVLTFKEHERQAYKISSEETKTNNNKYIEDLQKENKELKKFNEDIVANRKAA